MNRRKLTFWIIPTLLLILTSYSQAGDDVGPYVRSLWLVQRFGTAKSISPQNDQKTKGKLAKALGKQGILTEAGVQGLMSPSTFTKLAGNDGQLDLSEVKKCLDADVPESRRGDSILASPLMPRC